MPLQPPGNALFQAYVDGNGKWQSKFIGPEPIDCASCGRRTYRTASGACAWCKGTLVARGEA